MPATKLNPYDTVGRQRILRCSACGRALPCSVSDLMRYTRAGWPKCCGEVMAMSTEADKPAADDTALTTPALKV